MDILVVRIDNGQIRKKVAAGLSKISLKGGAYTFISKSEDYQTVSQEIIRFLSKTKGFSGIYVTLNKSHCDIVKRLEDNGIDTKNILFIDNLEKEDGCGAKNCIFIGNKSLTALSLAMSEACRHEEMKFLFFDSVTTLLVYEDLDTVERFLHFFLNKVKILEFLTVLMTVEEDTTNQILPILDQFCDESFKI